MTLAARKYLDVQLMDDPMKRRSTPPMASLGFGITPKQKDIKPRREEEAARQESSRQVYEASLKR